MTVTAAKDVDTEADVVTTGGGGDDEDEIMCSLEASVFTYDAVRLGCKSTRG